MMDIEGSPQSFNEINASVAKAARLDVHFSPQAKMVNNTQTSPSSVQKNKIRPRYIISSLLPSETHRLTGFAGEISVQDGDFGNSH